MRKTNKLALLLETIGQVLVGAVTKKELLASDEEVKKRLTVCAGCEYLEEKHLGCKKCGCRITYKSRLKNAKCPIGKW